MIVSVYVASSLCCALLEPVYGDFEYIEFLSLVVGAFALLLVIITLVSYSRSRDRRLLFVASAFSVFFIKTVIQHVDFFLFSLGPSNLELISTLLDALTLVLFFLAVTLKR